MPETITDGVVDDRSMKKAARKFSRRANAIKGVAGALNRPIGTYNQTEMRLRGAYTRTAVSWAEWDILHSEVGQTLAAKARAAGMMEIPWGATTPDKSMVNPEVDLEIARVEQVIDMTLSGLRSVKDLADVRDSYKRQKERDRRSEKEEEEIERRSRERTSTSEVSRRDSDGGASGGDSSGSSGSRSRASSSLNEEERRVLRNQGIDPDANLSRSDLRRAQREMNMKLHPDKGGSTADQKTLGLGNSAIEKLLKDK